MLLQETFFDSGITPTYHRLVNAHPGLHSLLSLAEHLFAHQDPERLWSSNLLPMDL